MREGTWSLPNLLFPLNIWSKAPLVINQWPEEAQNDYVLAYVYTYTRIQTVHRHTQQAHTSMLIKLTQGFSSSVSDLYFTLCKIYYYG